MRGGVTFATLHSEQSGVTRHTTSGSTAAHIHNGTATQPLQQSLGAAGRRTPRRHVSESGQVSQRTRARESSSTQRESGSRSAPHNGSPEADQLHTTGVRKSTSSTQRESGNRRAPHNGSPEVDQLHTTRSPEADQLHKIIDDVVQK